MSPASIYFGAAVFFASLWIVVLVVTIVHAAAKGEL